MSIEYDFFVKHKADFLKFGVNTPLRVAHFMAQIAHESDLKPKIEGFNYSAKRLLEVFPKYFTPQNVGQYLGMPQRIANRVYAGRMGNGNEPSGDGYRYRGRGFIQLTGKNNYRALSQAVGIDFVANPDLLLTEQNALISALWFWETNNINAYADKDDLVGVRKIVNGGTIGIDDCAILLKQFKTTFKTL